MAQGLKIKIGADSAQFDRTMKGVRGKLNMLNGPIKAAGAAAAAAAGAIAGLAAGIGVMIRSASQEAAGVEVLTMQFETLLGSAEKAQDRMEEITKFAATTPFEIKELAETSKLLQTLGGDMLATGEGLRMVGDAAAISGQPIAEVGLHIGRIFNAITSGTTAGESVARLQELGLMTGTVKRQFEELGKAHKSGRVAALSQNQAMQLLQSVFVKTEGAMIRLASTTQGKLSNMADNISQLKVAFGTGFNDGLKVALDAANNWLPKMKESMTKAGQILGDGIAEAVNGDIGKLIEIGKLIGVTIIEGMKLAKLQSNLEWGEQFNRVLEDYNPVRKIWRDDSTRASEFIRKEKDRTMENALQDAIGVIREQYQRVNPPPRMETMEGRNKDQQDKLNAWQASTNAILERIEANTRTQPFPAQ